jgi:hypothetical protein
MAIPVFDFWTIFVQYVFGGFWTAVFGLALLYFIIMGVLGRVSIYTTTWYCIMFIQCMALGYGFVPITIIITLLLLVATYFSVMSYLNSNK